MAQKAQSQVMKVVTKSSIPSTMPSATNRGATTEAPVGIDRVVQLDESGQVSVEKVLVINNTGNSY